jgi:ParB family transcriptional regulator, chromosome partitioning protein
MDKKALGKGLSALIPDKEETQLNKDVMEIPLEKILPNPMQPRKTFLEDHLQSLVASIKEFGVVQPVIVVGKGDHYQLVIGERRWRAAQQAGLKTIPAVIKEYSPAEGLQVALIENIQRQDLNPIEEANAFKFLLKEYALTHDDLARRLGKSRSALTNALRLLQLPVDMQKDLISGELFPGHARALLGIEEEILRKKLWERIKKDNLSVRQVELLVQKFSDQIKPKTKEAEAYAPWEEIKAVLQDNLGCKVMLKKGSKEKGRLELYFINEDELFGLVEMILHNVRFKKEDISLL